MGMIICGEYDAMSAETATATEGPVGFQTQEDRDIAQHLLRNRRGWYDHLLDTGPTKTAKTAEKLKSRKIKKPYIKVVRD